MTINVRETDLLESKKMKTYALIYIKQRFIVLKNCEGHRENTLLASAILQSIYGKPDLPVWCLDQCVEVMSAAASREASLEVEFRIHLSAEHRPSPSSRKHRDLSIIPLLSPTIPSICYFASGTEEDYTMILATAFHMLEVRTQKASSITFTHHTD